MTAMFSSVTELESRRADVIQEMVDRLEKVGDKLPPSLQAQMRESIAAFQNECNTGIKREWVIIKGTHGSKNRAGHAGELHSTTIRGRGSHAGDLFIRTEMKMPSKAKSKKKRQVKVEVYGGSFRMKNPLYDL